MKRYPDPKSRVSSSDSGAGGLVTSVASVHGQSGSQEELDER